jgi:phenylpropionate dioxygenase-like ring-hydroxylating dioxygenase large terminal subunit
MTITTPQSNEVEEGTDFIGSNSEDVKSKVLFPMQDSSHVPAERYYSREFFEQEKKHLWPHVWQMAARLEEIPNAGDFTEYEIVGQSILIIRQDDGSVKALHNACRHRATELGRGSGRFPGGQIVCPFHGWRWNIDGACSRVFGREGFEPEALNPDDLALRECLVDTWGGHVWINMDHNAPPLREALFPAANRLDTMGIENMRVKWWKEAIINCNWKLAQEAFFEGWHVKQTHPQLYTFAHDEDDEQNKQNVVYSRFVNGHGRFQSGDAKESFGGKPNFMNAARLLWDGQDAMTLERDLHIFQSLTHKMDPTDPAFPGAAIKALFEYAESAGIPMPEMTPEVLKMWGGDIFLFPNYLMLPMFANSLCYRVRPYNDDPDWCRMEVWSLTTYPVGQEPPKAVSMGRFDKDDDEHWGLIPRQDFANLERMQRGIKSQSLPETRLSHLWEMTISNMHEEMDRRIAAQRGDS